MLIAVPKEIKNSEYRVGLIPASVRELVGSGHRVVVEHNAGAGVGLFDEHYRAAGAGIVDSAAEVFERADMIVKVKEPQPGECRMLHEGQLLFTYSIWRRIHNRQRCCSPPVSRPSPMRR